ncbi:MAG: hypothetical protein U0350_44210 [Caldilineaceae bacterium]
MNEPINTQATSPLETRLTQAANRFPYPPTPDIAGRVARRITQPVLALQRRRTRLAAFIALFVLLIGLLSVPPVRAALLEFLQIGAVRIRFVQPTPAPTPITTMPPITFVPPQPTVPAITSVLDLAGETTLVQAQHTVKFPIRLPTYPADLGPPDKVFLQHIDGTIVVLVWLDQTHPHQVRMSLHLLTSAGIAWKMLDPNQVAQTTVHGQLAAWTYGPYIISTGSGPWETTRLMQGHALIWTDGEITYRLECNLSLSEAVRVAESLK